MKWPEINMPEPGNLIVRVITVGYQKKGESIIFLLIDKCDNKILYSIVIDSFKRNSVNQTVQLLRQYHVFPLDILCWSHPDYDHSCGIDEIWKEFCSDSTRVITPISFWSDDYSIKAFNPNNREKFFVESIRNINKRTKCSFHPKSVSEGGCELVGSRTLSTLDGKIHFNVFIVSPFVESLKGQIDEFIDGNSKKQPTRNQTCVSLLIQIGPYNMLFPSDLPNDEISMMNEDLLEHPIFVKIPHHGSDSSIRLTDYIYPNSNTLATCTVYKSTKKASNLPMTHVLDRYCDNCDAVLCTGSDGNHDFGIITTDFDFFGSGTCKISTSGSALFIKKPINIHAH